MAREALEELDGFLSLLADHGELKHGPERFYHAAEVAKRA